MNEVEVNKEAWGLLSKDHYENFKNVFKKESIN
jgi:hypothetical protein